MDAARKVAAVIATGRSDYPNQINNVLAFPGVFRGLLDARARNVTTAMLLRAADALAHVVTDEQLNASYVVPSVFDPQVPKAVAAAVVAAAEADPTPGWSCPADRAELPGFVDSGRRIACMVAGYVTTLVGRPGRSAVLLADQSADMTSRIALRLVRPCSRSTNSCPCRWSVSCCRQRASWPSPTTRTGAPVRSTPSTAAYVARAVS